MTVAGDVGAPGAAGTGTGAAGGGANRRRSVALSRYDRRSTTVASGPSLRRSSSPDSGTPPAMTTPLSISMRRSGEAPERARPSFSGTTAKRAVTWRRSSTSADEGAEGCAVEATGTATKASATAT